MAEDWNSANWVGRLRPGLGSGTLTDEQRDAAFVAYLEASTRVENPWWQDAERTAGVARNLGLDVDTPAGAIRRQLWERKFGA